MQRNRYLEKAECIYKDMLQDRRMIHANPELGDHLPETTAYVLERLKGMGIEGKAICKSGIMAEIVGKKQGKTILIRADMDALPMREESGLPFASTNGYAHTCGHDMHTAGLLGTARILKGMEAELEGTVRLMFQPDEEALTGANTMIGAGILDGVDVALSGHVFSGSLKPGSIAVSPGYVMASADRFKISVKGSGSHGSTPHKAVDPINTGVHIFLGLQELVARETNAMDPTVITVGSFCAGTAPNIIPELAVMEGSIRAKSREGRSFAKRRLVQLCKGVAAAYGSECEIEFTGGTPAVYNDPELFDTMKGYAAGVVKYVEPMEFTMMSEDFAMVSELIPSVYIGIGAGGDDEVYTRYNNHNPKVRFSEESLIYIGALYAQCAVSWLENQKE